MCSVIYSYSNKFIVFFVVMLACLCRLNAMYTRKCLFILSINNALIITVLLEIVSKLLISFLAPMPLYTRPQNVGVAGVGVGVGDGVGLGSTISSLLKNGSVELSLILHTPVLHY